jgi:hypothetical protein
MVRKCADTADPGGYLGHIFCVPALNKLLEPSDLWDLKIAFLAVARVI